MWGNIRKGQEQHPGSPETGPLQRARLRSGVGSESDAAPLAQVAPVPKPLAGCCTRRVLWHVRTLRDCNHDRANGRSGRGKTRPDRKDPLTAADLNRLAAEIVSGAPTRSRVTILPEVSPIRA